MDRPFVFYVRVRFSVGGLSTFFSVEEESEHVGTDMRAGEGFVVTNQKFFWFFYRADQGCQIICICTAVTVRDVDSPGFRIYDFFPVFIS